MRRFVASVSMGVVCLASVPCGAQESRAGRIEVTAQAGASVAPGDPLSVPLGGRVAWVFNDRWDLALDGVWYGVHDAPSLTWPQVEADGALFVTTSFALVPDFGAPGTPAIALDLGLGGIDTRVLSVVDPDIRSFSSRAAVALTGGVTIRARIATSFRLDFHLRDVVYQQAEESSVIAPPGEPNVAGSRGDPATWYESSGRLTNRVELLVGITFGR